jgi:hypothetical protein
LQHQAGAVGKPGKSAADRVGRSAGWAGRTGWTGRAGRSTATTTGTEQHQRCTPDKKPGDFVQDIASLFQPTMALVEYYPNSLFSLSFKYPLDETPQWILDV